MVETYTLWHSIFTYLLRVSIHNGSGPCAYIVSCIGASRIHDNTGAELSPPGKLCLYNCKGVMVNGVKTITD